MLVPINSKSFFGEQGVAGTTPQTSVELTVIEKTFDSEVGRLAIKYNVDETLARKIMQCESFIYGQEAENKNYRLEYNPQLGTTTMVHWSTDVGYWQVNDFWHKESALSMGYDIYKWEDNLEYGFILASRDGLRHWKASRHCWSN
jgi:hypothetical protein